jgi:uncharacterized membrane protein YedE/YeeE
MKTVLSILIGAYFGSVLIFSQAFHWQRIQEMFYFESFHMYGLLFTAIATGLISVKIIKRTKLKSVYGKDIVVKQKPLNLRGNILGGLFFGSGWALTGACTAPAFILIGTKWQIGLLIVVGAFLGVFLYAFLHKRV